MDELGGCLGILIGAAIILYIIFWLVTVALTIMAVIALVIVICGLVYGTYRALLCYFTALFRVYGTDAYYEAGNSVKTLAAVALLPFVIFIVLLIINNYPNIIDMIM